MAVKFCKTGVVSTNAFSNSIPIQDMQTKLLDDDSVWALIFEHNCQGGTVLFESVDEAMNTQSNNKYSRLYLLDNESFKAISDGKYEFMLCYPDDTSDYNRWKQTNNPCNEYKGTDDASLTADGYEAISVPWTGKYWGGLTRQNESDASTAGCVLSGSVGSSNWYYAIGAFETWEIGIPSYANENSAYTTANRVQLWIRIDNTNITSSFKIYDKCIVANDFIEI